MIKNAVKKISNLGGTLYSIESLINKTNHRLILPFYHAVTDDNPIHIKNLYEPRGVEEFKEDLDFLLKNYKSVSLNELIDLSKSGKKISENCFHLTFDDGLKEFFTIVAPLLKERGIHATVFLNSDFIDNNQLFFRFKASILYEKLKDENILNFNYSENNLIDKLARDNNIDFGAYLQNEQPYLTSSQIEELIGQGFTFGAHSINHPLYKELSIADQIYQTKESLDFVSNRFKLDYKVFSFPFTDDGVGLNFFKQIESLTDLTFGCAGIKEDSVKNHLQRIPMETNHQAEEIIKAEYSYCLMKQKAGKNKIERK